MKDKIERILEEYKIEGAKKDLITEELCILFNVSKSLNDGKDPNIRFNKRDFKYSEFIQGTGKEYNYVSNKTHYFIDGVLVKILNS